MNIILVPFRILYKIYFALYFAVSLIIFYPFFEEEVGSGLSNVIIHPPLSTIGKTKDDVSALLAELNTIINTPLLEKYRLTPQLAI